MNKNTVFGAIAVIVALPFIYLLLTALKGDPLPRFNGREVVVIDADSGTITVPSAEDAKQGMPLTATFTKAFVERTTGKKLARNKNLDLTLNTVSDKIQECGIESSVPARAGFNVAEMCAPFAFEKSKEPKKTALYVAPEERLIVFGKSGQNQVRVHHHGMIATYESSDMTQSDRKYEACVVRIMMDFVIGLPLDEAKTCTLKP
jgi:hypothetical protein